MNFACGFRPDQLDAVYELLGRLAEVFVATLGPSAEVVVHDLRNVDASVVAIAGDLTQRQVGAPIPDPEFLPERLSTFGDDQIGYATRTPRGRALYSSTVWIRDDTGRIVGAICLNVDQGDLRRARDLLTKVLDGMPALPGNANGSSGQALTTFASDLEQFVDIALDEVMRRSGRARHQLTREDRVAAIRELDSAGVFRLRHAAEVVARHLGVSRASVFNYLRDSRQPVAVSDHPGREQ